MELLFPAILSFMEMSRIIFIHVYRSYRSGQNVVWRSFPILQARMPQNLSGLEQLMKIARKRAEQMALALWGRIKAPDIMYFTIHRLGIGKGKRKTLFVNVFRFIKVDKEGKIISLTAPSKHVNPDAYRIYEEFKIKQHLVKGKEDREEKLKGLARLLGIRTTKPEVKIRSMRKYQHVSSPSEINMLDLLQMSQGTPVKPDATLMETPPFIPFYFDEETLKKPQDTVLSGKKPIKRVFKLDDYEPFKTA